MIYGAVNESESKAGAGSAAGNADVKAQKELSLGKDTYKEEPRD